MHISLEIRTFNHIGPPEKGLAIKDDVIINRHELATVVTTSIVGHDYVSDKVWDEIIYSFPTFNGCTVEVWDGISYFIPHFTVVGLSLINMCKSGPW